LDGQFSRGFGGLFHLTEKGKYLHIDVFTGESIRHQTFRLLDKNHELKAKMLCKLIELPYQKYGNTIKEYRKQWKRQYQNGSGLNGLSFHAVKYYLYALKSIDRDAALKSGVWQQSKARNRCLIFKEKQLGRITWFETGRVNVWIKKPATKGKMIQLLAYGFCWTGLIKDDDAFKLWVNSARPKGAHLVNDLGERLPYSRMDFLKEGLGVIVKTGDVSHPSGVEIEFVYPRWAERNELLFKRFSGLMERLFTSKPVLKRDFVV